MEKIKRIILFLLSMILVFSLISCKDENSDKVKIRFATWDNAEDLENQKKVIDEFNKMQDKIYVTLEAYGSNYDTKITAAMGSGDAPDVMYMWDYPKYENGLLPLDELIAKEGKDYENNFYEALWNYNSVNGKKYGIPVGYTTHVLYYNKDLFDKANVEYPNENWTWDDLYNAAKKISELDEKIYGIEFPIKPDPYDYEMFAWSNGSSYVSKTGDIKGYLNSKETIEAFSTIQKLIKDNVGISTKDSGEKDFLLGKVGMYIYGSWSLNKLKEKGLNFGVEVLPMFSNKESKSIISSSGVAISKTSKHVEEAFEFIKFYTGKEMNIKRLGFEFPVLKDVVKEYKIEEDPINSKFYKMLEKSKDNIPASFIVKDYTKLSDEIQLGFEKILNKNSLENPSDVLNDIAK